MEVGEKVVFVGDARDGVERGEHGRVMAVRHDGVMVRCRVRERLQDVLVHTWEVMPEALWRRLSKRLQ